MPDSTVGSTTVVSNQSFHVAICTTGIPDANAAPHVWRYTSPSPRGVRRGPPPQPHTARSSKPGHTAGTNSSITPSFIHRRAWS